jgi:hypothetical protein
MYDIINLILVSGKQSWGIFLGPPAGYLIMIDFDSDDIGELFEQDRRAWRRAVEEVIDYIAFKFVVRKGDVNVLNSITVYSRRGGHVIVKLGKEDWERLHATVKANSKLGRVCVPGSAGQRWCGELELRTIGVTPLRSYKHVLAVAPPLQPVQLRQPMHVLGVLGVRLPEPQPLTPSNGSSTRETAGQVAEPGDEVRAGVATASWRRLSEAEINRIVEALAQYWVPGYRNQLEIALLGWMIKARVSRQSALEVVRRIVERVGDKEKRLAEVDRHYRMVVAGERDARELVGRTGLVRTLQQVIQQQNPSLSDEEVRDRAIAVVAELERVLGPRHTILVRTPYKTGVWLVNDPRRGIVLLRERVDEDGEVRRVREYISDWYVRRVMVTRAEGAHYYYYKVQFRNARTYEKITMSGQLD